MINRRNVIITGAGATTPWGAPSTSELTNLLRNDDVFINDAGLCIGEYLYSQLNIKGKGRQIYEPNFETILYLIEKIHEIRTLKHHMPTSFFRMNDIFDIKTDIEKELIAFEQTNPNIYNDAFMDTAVGTGRIVTKDRHYYELFQHFISLIKKRVEQYDKADSKDYIKLNKNFNSFLNSLKQNDGIIRFYTLNYDYLPVNISPLSFYDGYDTKSGKINIQRIINDDNTDCFYHLHGSIKLNLDGEKSDLNESYSPQKNFSNNELIPTNIISGYNKLDRIQGDTYFHFYNSLVDDCYKADRIFIIGYSFSDLHINAAIRGAMLNNKAQLVCIDCCDLSKYNYNYMKSKPTKEYQIDYIETGTQYVKYNTETDKVKLHLCGLEDFLRLNKYKEDK